MADSMAFPDTLNEFLEQYQFKDTEEIYTNGQMLIPVFRVKQWAEHTATDVVERCKGHKMFDTYDRADYGWDAGCGRAKLNICQHQADEIRELKNQWIPVTERLPKEWCPVLGLIQYHDKEESPTQMVLWYLGNGHWRETWRGDMIESDVTHWMPLPEPPEEET